MAFVQLLRHRKEIIDVSQAGDIRALDRTASSLLQHFFLLSLRRVGESCENEQLK